MSDTPKPPPRDPPRLPPELKLLRVMTLALMAVMILGLLAIVGVVVTSLPHGMATSGPPLPPELKLPAGLEAQAVTLGKDWIAVLAKGPDGPVMLLYPPAGSEPRAVIPIRPAVR